MYCQNLSTFTDPTSFQGYFTLLSNSTPLFTEMSSTRASVFLIIAFIAASSAIKCWKCGQYSDGVGSITPCNNRSAASLEPCAAGAKYCIVSSIFCIISYPVKLISANLLAACLTLTLIRTVVVSAITDIILQVSDHSIWKHKSCGRMIFICIKIISYLDIV